MPVDVLLLPASSLNTKWKEPYASASLNQKFAGIIAPGIYRGLKMVVDPLLGDRTIVVQADTSSGDHVAIYQNANGYSVTYRDATSGDVTLSLTAYSSVVVLVCVYIDYTPGTNTTGAFRVYTQSEYDVLASDTKDALVILGTVTVPASGAIPDANISLVNRTLASTNLSRGTILNAPVIRNPGFELGETNGTYSRSSVFWDKSFTVGSATWKTGTSVVDSGLKSIEFTITSGPVTGDLAQQIGVETTEGELHLVSVRLQQNRTVTSGSFLLFLEWADVNGALLSTSTIDLDGGAVDSAFRTVSSIVEAPAGAVTLRAAGIRATTLSPVSTGVFAYIDNIGVFVEPADTKYPYPFDQAFRRKLSATDLKISDPTGVYSDLAGAVRFDKSTPASEGQVVVEPSNPSNLPPAFQVPGRLYGLGGGLLSTEDNALKARVTAPSSTAVGVDFTLMWESARSGESTGSYTQPVLRTYASVDGKWVFTSNAIWGGATWTKDVSGQNATKISIANDGLYLYTRTADGAWSDSSWDDTTKLMNSLSSAANALLPRLSHGLWAGAANELTLISQFNFGSLLNIRLYAMTDSTATFSLMATLNASWDGANWNRDTSATGASRVVMEMTLPGSSSLDGGAWKFQIVDATTTASWAENGWVQPAYVDQYGVHFTNASRYIYVGSHGAIINDGGVYFQRSLNYSYFTIVAGRTGSQYIYYPAPELPIGSVLTGYDVIISKNDTGGSVTALLVDTKDATEVAAGGSAGSARSIGGLYTAGYYGFGENGLSATYLGAIVNITIPNHLSQRPSQYYCRVQPSATATGGNDLIYGVLFYYNWYF